MWRRVYAFFGIFTALWCFCFLANCEESEEGDENIKILIVSGGASHDFDQQLRILQAGLQKRTKREIAWTVRRDSRGRSDTSPPFWKEGWADNSDLVIHLYCYPRIADPKVIDQVLAPHREGKPAILLHGTLQSFRTVDQRWYEFCGAKTTSHSRPGEVEVRIRKEDDLLASSKTPWKSPHEELYLIEEVEEGVTVLAEGTLDHKAIEQVFQPVAWIHEYGPSKAKVFASSLGNEVDGIAVPQFLDLVSRGLLWALGKNVPEEFNQVAPEKVLSRLPADGKTRSFLNHGVSVLHSGDTRAMSEDVTDGHRAGNAVDGRGETYWQASSPGPSVWEVNVTEPEEITALAIEWLGDLPLSYVAEGSTDGVSWHTLGKGGELESEKRSRSLHHFPPIRVRSVRVSIPATGPDEKPGIREISGFQRREEIPSALALEAGLSDGLRSTALPDGTISLRLHPDWTVGPEKTQLPNGIEPIEIVECIDGSIFLLATSPEGGLQVLRFVSGEPATVFLNDIEERSSITWDGEWLYLLEEHSLSKFRDTSGNGVADERRRVGRLSSVEMDLLPEISGMQLAIDGWIYAVSQTQASPEQFTPDSGDYGIVRFQRDGTGFQQFVVSQLPITGFQSLGDLSFEVKTREDSGEIVPRFLRHGVFPGRPLESFPPEPREHITIDSSGDFAFTRTRNSGSELFLQVEGLEAVFPKEEGCLAIVSGDDGTFAFELAPVSGKELRPAISLDETNDLDLFPLFSSASPLIRQEAVFEVQRRRSNLEEQAMALLQDRQSSSYLPSLALLSQMEGERTFVLLSDAARLSHQAAAYRLLGDRKEARNHRVFAEVTRAKDPEVTAEILAAIARSGSEIAGLDDLVLSFAMVEDEELSRTAVEWLVLAKETTPATCFRVIDAAGTSPEMLKVAFAILARIHAREVVDGLKERLDKTTTPFVRREILGTLCQLYFNRGHTWKGSHEIGAILQNSLGDRRVDVAWLLDCMLQNDIPVEDLSDLTETFGREIPLQAMMIDLMNRENAVPPGALPWLNSLVKAESHDPSLRANAASLLGEELPFTEFFQIAAELLSVPLLPESQELLLASWKSRGDFGEYEAALKSNRYSENEAKKNLARLALGTLHGGPKKSEPKSLSSRDLYELGFETFSRLRCDCCHNIHGEGDFVGPDLVSWIKEHDDDAFGEAIKDPHLQISDGYQRELIELETGNRLRGVVTGGTISSVEIADEAGNRILVERADVRSRSDEEGSLMPSFAGKVSETEKAAMIRFLRGLGELSANRE